MSYITLRGRGYKIIVLKVHAPTEDKSDDTEASFYVEQNQNIRIFNDTFENLAKFKYLGTTLASQNDIHDEIKSRLNSGNASYY
jgi:hypothetical protein